MNQEQLKRAIAEAQGQSPISIGINTFADGFKKNHNLIRLGHISYINMAEKMNVLLSQRSKDNLMEVETGISAILAAYSKVDRFKAYINLVSKWFDLNQEYFTNTSFSTQANIQEYLADFSDYYMMLSNLNKRFDRQTFRLSKEDEYLEILSKKTTIFLEKMDKFTTFLDSFKVGKVKEEPEFELVRF